MKTDRIVLKNGTQTASFVQDGSACRPEWMRLGRRPMLRFKDHEFLNIGGLRVTQGELREQSQTSLLFGGRANLARVEVEWSVRVSAPADGASGFTVTTRFVPLDQPIEALEALTAFELPYEYDGAEKLMTVMCQQPVYRLEDGKETSGAGYAYPFWYYAKPGAAHLTYFSASPLMVNRVCNKDGSNERCTMLIGNWDVCSVHDMFAQPTRSLSDIPQDVPFPDKELRAAPGLRGMKFLLGAVNWNASLHKDPNVVVDPGVGLSQEVTVDFAAGLPDGRWDAWLAAGWERMVRIHFPRGGRMPAWEVAKAQGASWIEAAEWLAEQFEKPGGCPGFFYPERGTCVYSPHTRPKWDHGVEGFCGQWTGPLAYLGHVWKDEAISRAADRLEGIFNRDRAHPPEHVWTVGPTPQYVAVMRKAHIAGISDEARDKVEDYLKRRTEFVLNPPKGARRGDPGILAWDALANLLAADLFDTRKREAAAKELLARVNKELDGAFWTFNCAALGDLVGAGQARPFGHAVALTANALAWQRLGEEEYLTAAERFGNLLLGLHFITWNESPSPDLDTRGWAHGSTGGRDQWAQMPPWETSFSLQQLACLICAGRGRAGFYDVLWLHSHTGLAMFPKARTMKRLYTPAMSITYRPIDSLATEREFYRRLPYLAYENPWDQTMLAGYQGVEPLVLSLYYGGGLVRTGDDRVLALVPQTATFDGQVARQFTVELWNPLDEPVETALYVTAAAKRREEWTCAGAVSGTVCPDDPWTEILSVPPRSVTRVMLKSGT